MNSISRTLVALASVLVLSTGPATALADEVSDPTEPGSSADEATETTDRSDSPAVRGFALAFDAPSYTYVANTDGGWSDVPRTTANLVGSALRGVAPIGDRFGFRFGAAGSFVKTVYEDEASLVQSRSHAGLFELGTSVFWRSPERASLGLAYRAEFAFVPRFVAPSIRQDLSLEGTLFLGDFDLDGRLGYAFGTPRYLVYGGTAPGGQQIEFRQNGVLVDVGTTWYAHDTLSAGIGIDFSYVNEAPPDGLLLDGSFKITRGGAGLIARWLPPLAANRWVLLEGRLGYSRIIEGFSGDPFAYASNLYEVGAVLRIVLPGVPSLKVLAREY